MFNSIIKFFVKDYQNIDSAYVQLGYIRVVSWISIILNMAFSILKIGVGWYYSTIALMSDGMDSFSNVISSFILIISYKFLSRKETLEQPFGSGRVVYIANFLIALILAFTGFEMIILSSKHLLYNNTIPTFNSFVLCIVFLSFIINEWTAQFCFYVAKTIKSDVMHTEGIHRRWDNLLSLTVMLAWLASLYGLLWVDACVGILFGFIIIKSSYTIAKENIKELVGTRPPIELVEQIVRLGQTIPGVINIHEIVIHNYGKRIMASIHVEIDENLNLREAHLICDKVEDLLQDKLNIYATTHADPINIQTPIVSLLSAHKKTLLQDDYLESFVVDIEHIYVGQDHNNPNMPFVSLDLFLRRPLDKHEEDNIHQILYPKVVKIVGQEVRLKIRPRPLFGTNKVFR